MLKLYSNFSLLLYSNYTLLLDSNFTLFLNAISHFPPLLLTILENWQRGYQITCLYKLMPVPLVALKAPSEQGAANAPFRHHGEPYADNAHFQRDA